MATHQKAQATIISVKVKPNSRVSALVEGEDGAWLAQLKSPPVDGKANEELVRLIAKQFGCRKSAVSLKSGVSARTKLVKIEGSGLTIQNDVANEAGVLRRAG